MAKRISESFTKARREASDAVRELDAITATFKPQFGNEKHIALIHSLGTLGAMRTELAHKLKIMKGGEKLANDIAFKARGLIHQIKSSNGESATTT